MICQRFYWTWAIMISDHPKTFSAIASKYGLIWSLTHRLGIWLDPGINTLRTLPHWSRHQHSTHCFRFSVDFSPNSVLVQQPVNVVSNNMMWICICARIDHLYRNQYLIWSPVLPGKITFLIGWKDEEKYGMHRFVLFLCTLGTKLALCCS